MNGVHDMGGMANLGRLQPDEASAPFKSAWEARVFAMALAAPASPNIDAARHQRELIPGPDYLAMDYFERWFRGLRDALLAGGLVTEGELASGRAEPGSAPAQPRLKPDRVAAVLARAGSYRREAARPPKFFPGERVRALVVTPAGHTRLPRYARGRQGVVERWHGAHVFPDSHAHGRGEDPHHLYGVRFTGEELWGAGGDPRSSVSLDIWEPYLERV